ncbi:response regulator transcription factor [Cyanobacteria bacterium FACHB-DQ100]|uniref:response regulator transcription factor n=1 Tax=unclassified Leptolyngbya TaxID=2650499 RepID=UPI001680EC70|nr:response regulator transcription factor [Leptolyngbya sp. FACHB-17]MBD1822826.1 response regulator transcription factor [Cyanobacteria bacterium FACHB-DQ100]MBD2079379.1 response regulator transcription factor [Leptolyngbya sp. FACHB-17]
MPLTILVAEDDLGTRLSICDYLECSGYSVVSAENGKDAIALLETHQPHLIVTDVSMPLMDGYEFVRQVRRRPALRLLPIVFLTGRTDTDERVRGYQLGCDVYLAKPFELPELGAVVRNLLDRSQMIESSWRSRQEFEVAAEAEREKPDINIAFTDREQEVLTLLSDGLSNNQIGDRLHLSSRTVEKHVSSLLRKTDTSNRAELVRFAMEHHLVL